MADGRKGMYPPPSWSLPEYRSMLKLSFDY